MENLKKELEAIQKIADELGKIDEDRRSHVLDYVMNSLNIKQTKPVQEKVPDVKTETTMDLAEFIQTKKPKNNYQLIASLGYFLEQIRGIKEFGAKEIRDANSEARLPPISNITRDIQNTQRQYNFIVPSPKNKSKKTLSTYGIDLVKALPNQEEARKIMSCARPKLRKKNSKNEDETQ